ncbi:uncharacterized protein SOCE26_057530 [Sorangium cellulosum]|uniref:HAMP domain-containing protein n=2 Tax=Sorangium cellulosum TaxID=56 RepID=A0A2L0EYH2_SORCE|nr:uncharacterized protein SOCE26_057530 [Sorangium cellulosum]
MYRHVAAAACSRLQRAAKRIAAGERDIVVPTSGSGEIRELGEQADLISTFFMMAAVDPWRHKIVERARAIGPGKVEDALLDLEGDALVRWPSEPVPR